jgi:alkylation response protein AidB-like acyl-CoA dehydrogenase
MTFVLSEEQESIRKTAQSFFGERVPVAHFRALRDARDHLGFSREIWRELANLGLLGMAVPETYGGAGLGFTELGLVLTESGRTLAPTPLLSTIVLGASAIALGGDDALKRALLPAVCAGEKLLAFAHEEGARFAPYQIATRAQSSSDGYRLTGAKSLVLDGHVADELVVVARTSGEPGQREGISLFLVPADAPGVTASRLSLVDSRGAARIRFDGAPARALLGREDAGADLLDVILERATIGLAAEMLGGIEEVFDRTIAYLKTRRQFGVPIGTFQALKHRAAHLFCEVELSKSIVADALAALDASRPDVAIVASVAKARTSDTFIAVTNEGVQMHGGVGVTDELDIGLFMKRARVTEMTFGTAAYHRDRFARLHGY